MQAKFLLTLIAGFIPFIFSAQNYFSDFNFTEADSIRGELQVNRSCYDVHHYDLNIAIDMDRKSISGYNKISLQYLEQSDQIQIDLFENLKVDSILVDSEKIDYTRKFDAIFINTPEWNPDSKHEILVAYSGIPIIARHAPWDGGFSWDYDSTGQPFVGVSCEGIGASLWWPCKDHLSDEPDSMDIKITIPSTLMVVANGNLISTEEQNDQSTYHWKVSYPINNYNVTLNIANYAHFNEQYISGVDTLDLDYYVLKHHLEIAKEHFKQVPGVLEAFEYYFGSYPFWNDGYALVETPYLGMEHQSAIAYGNQYMRGYLGRMIPKDMDWDYIIVHETGHEYWGNSVSITDHADMWIHESFTTYMEALYVEYHYGREAVDRYLSLFKKHDNKLPIIGPANVNFQDWGSSDHYFKGSWILHTIRSIYNEDERWFRSLRDIYNEFKYSVTNSEELLNYMCHQFEEHPDYDFSLRPILDQYLYHPNIPTLEYRIKEKKKSLVVDYRWDTDVEGFEMPIEIGKQGQWFRVKATNKWAELIIPNFRAIDFDINGKGYLINEKKLK